MPLKYIAIEPGSLIKFPKLIDNMQAYGQNYTAAINYTQFQGVDEWAGWGDGQVYFPLFFVTSVNISQGDIVVEAIRLHRLNDNTSVQFDGWDDFGIGDIHGGYEWDPNLEGYCQWDGEIDFSHLRTEWSCMNSGGEAWYSQDEITPPDTDEDEEGLEVEEDEEFGVGYCLMPNGNLVSDIDEGDCVAMGGAWSDIAIDAPRGNFMFFSCLHIITQMTLQEEVEGGIIIINICLMALGLAITMTRLYFILFMENQHHITLIGMKNLCSLHYLGILNLVEIFKLLHMIIHIQQK